VTAAQDGMLVGGYADCITHIPKQGE